MSVSGWLDVFSRNILKVIKFIWLALSLLLLVLVVVGAVKAILMISRKTPYHSENEKATYLSRSVNRNNNSTSMGYVTINENLEDMNDFVSYEDSTGTHTLITNFGADGYECSGSCYCSNCVDGRRATQTLLTRGLYVLVSAASVSVAINFAKTHFHKECVKSFENECPSNSIVSETTTCIELFAEDDNDDLGEEWEYDRNERKIITSYDYKCYGPCVPKTEELEDRYVDEYGLDFEEILGMHTELSTITERLLHRMINVCQTLNGKMEIVAITKEWAIKVFLEKLEEVCEKSSKMSRKMLRKLNTDIELIDPKFMDEITSLCKAPVYEEVWEDMRQNKKVSVWCERLMEKPKLFYGEPDPKDFDG